MSRCSIKVAIASLLIAILVSTAGAFDEATRAKREAVSIGSMPALAQSSGQYKGHPWHIDENHLMWWNGKPYVRFGFTGTGNPSELIKLGFDQFTLAPEEEWPISGPDPDIVRRVHETLSELEAIGATYYGILNAFWPWRYGNLIAESDKAAVFVRDVRDVTEHAGEDLALDLEVRWPISEDDQSRTRPERVQAVLFDLQHSKRQDISDHVESIAPVTAEPEREARPETDEGWGRGKAYRVHFKSIYLPECTSLRLVVAMEARLAEVPGVNGLVPLWKPGILEFYRDSLKAFRSAYAKPGLRGLQFGDEINTYPVSLLTARTYLDIRHDAVALKAYREWLAERFGNTKELNQEFGTSYASFDKVEWQVPLHPLSPELARTDEAAEREESWAEARTAWGLADTVDQLRTVSRVQDEFRIWLCGHWLAEYARMAKEIIGSVPVFVCSAAVGGDANQYLAMHRWALYEGVDGLIRNHYGHGGEEERDTLANLGRWMKQVQEESNRAKHLWANEVGYVRPHITDDEWAAAEARELGPGSSFGSQWAFPSQESLRQMLVLLTQYGYRGFNRFLMNPSAPRAGREVEWMAELRSETVPLVVETEAPPAPPRFTRAGRTAAAESHQVVVWPQEYQGALRNPLKGFRPDINPRAFGHEYATLGRCYLKWNELENNGSDGVDRIMRVCNERWKDVEKHNVKVIPRVYLDWDEKEGNEYWSADMQVGDYSSEQFKRRVRRLIQRLGECWDDDPRVAWVQLGIIGYWGEHHHPSPDADMQKLLGDAFAQAFRNKKVTVRHPWEFTDYQFGIYWDSWAHIQQVGNHGEGIAKLNAETGRWKVCPMDGECAYNWGRYQQQPGDNPNDTLRAPVHREWLIDTIRWLHGNDLGWVASYDPSDPLVRAGAEEVQKAFGYRFVIDEVRYDGMAEPGGTFNVTFWVRNTGSAPFYYNWPVEVSLLDRESREVVWKETLDGADIRTWLPGDRWNKETKHYDIAPATYEVSGNFSVPQDLRKGEYILALAILDPAGMVPSVRFAMENYFAGGRHPIGMVGVREAPSESELDPDLFDNPAADRTLHYELKPRTKD